jgi:hypothetical protein
MYVSVPLWRYQVAFFVTYVVCDSEILFLSDLGRGIILKCPTMLDVALYREESQDLYEELLMYEPRGC